MRTFRCVPSAQACSKIITPLLAAAQPRTCRCCHAARCMLSCVLRGAHLLSVIHGGSAETRASSSRLLCRLLRLASTSPSLLDSSWESLLTISSKKLQMHETAATQVHAAAAAAPAVKAAVGVTAQQQLDDQEHQQQGEGGLSCSVRIFFR